LAWSSKNPLENSLGIQTLVASFSVLHDRELVGQLYGYDPDGDAITAQLVSGPSNGTLTLNPDGTFTYTPNTHYVGLDSFTYTWSDGLTTGNTATVVIDVYNNAPYVYDASFSVLHDRELAGSMYGYDANGDAITVPLLSSPGVFSAQSLWGPTNGPDQR
jgi:VCBS repeat-containing protein